MSCLRAAARSTRATSCAAASSTGSSGKRMCLLQYHRHQRQSTSLLSATTTRWMNSGAKKTRSSASGYSRRIVSSTTNRAAESGGGDVKQSRFKRRDPNAKPPPAPLGSGPPPATNPVSAKILEKSREENPDVEVVPLQQTQFQGVANIDDESEETSQSNVLKRRAILLAGDVASFFVFATIGRASHGEALNPIDIFGTASPFILGWTSASYLLGARGAFGDCSRRSGVDKLGKILPSVGKTVLLGVPIGVVIRSVATFHVPEISFLFVSLGFNGVALLLWRVGVSADIRVGGDQSATSGAKKASKRGNPLEFLSLLKSLVTRW